MTKITHVSILAYLFFGTDGRYDVSLAPFITYVDVHLRNNLNVLSLFLFLFFLFFLFHFLFLFVCGFTFSG